jgi:hypothetical protein
MKAKRTIDEMEKPLNSILGVNIGLPSLSETGVAVMSAENVINAYEKEAQEILARNGYPLTLEELWAKKDEYLPDLANGRGLSQVYSIFWMLWGLKGVRVDIEKNNADMAVCDMAYALHWAIKAQLKPVQHLIGMVEKWTGSGENGGKISAEIRKEKARSTKEVEQAEADKIWRRRPSKSNAQVGKEVGELIGGNPDTIRKRIKKPLP